MTPVLGIFFPDVSSLGCRYFINILFDTTVVVGMNFLLLRAAEIGALRWFQRDISSGNYGDPPELQRFIEQLGVWMLIVLVVSLGWAVAG